MAVTKQMLIENLLESLYWLSNLAYLLLTLGIAAWLANAVGATLGGGYLGTVIGFVVFGGAFLGMMLVYYLLILND
ncbi:hypothetical protein ACFO5R_07050 [Halosolutus amylolyticus]|uniref:NADH dehydrogenase subunit 6 n=1 Tax=Halosolutus amylolyticus TaxID=2932267 RepID=A0ABD5PNR3_9EURY|nr:hypothetical protein [Halosolutus amylolyticus]